MEFYRKMKEELSTAYISLTGLLGKTRFSVAPLLSSPESLMGDPPQFRRNVKQWHSALMDGVPYSHLQLDLA